ncbi:chromosome segregation protein, partial [Amycolatopsis sp. NPDC000740]
EALRTVRASLAEQVRSARTVLAEAQHVLGETDGAVPADIKAAVDEANGSGPKSGKNGTQASGATASGTGDASQNSAGQSAKNAPANSAKPAVSRDVEQTVRLRTSDVPKPQPQPRPAGKPTGE